MDPDEQLWEDICNCIGLLADWAGIDVPGEAYPAVGFVDEDEGCYFPFENTLTISSNAENPGLAKFEEASHFLRCYAKKESWTDRITSNLSKMTVHEFYGGLGEVLGKELAKGTSLENMFGTQETNYLNYSKLSGAIAYYVQHNSTKGFIPQFDITCAFAEEIQDTQMSCVIPITMWANTGNNDKCISRLSALKEKNSQKKLTYTSTFSARFFDMHTWVDGLNSAIDETIADIKKYKVPENLNETRSEELSEKFMSKILKYRQTEIDLLLHSNSIFNLDESSFRHHFEGYIAAELLTFEELNKMKDIYTWTDRQARNRFINPLRKQLKEKYC